LIQGVIIIYDFKYFLPFLTCRTPRFRCQMIVMNQVVNYEIAFNELADRASDHRFRIEHAQHLHPDDIPRFASLGVIPAMQAVHLSSDRPWAIDRLGEQRIKEGAYMWQALLQSGIPIVNGTDVPVEPLNPIASLYASISRKTLKGTPEGGYEPEQKMTREQALRSYTRMLHTAPLRKTLKVLLQWAN